LKNIGNEFNSVIPVYKFEVVVLLVGWSWNVAIDVFEVSSIVFDFWFGYILNIGEDVRSNDRGQRRHSGLADGTTKPRPSICRA